MPMKKLLALLLCLPMAAWADAYYSFDGTNDRMVGSFTSTYADPMTIGFWLRYADHPTATDVIVNIGNANNSQSNSYICRFGATDNTFQATASDSGGSVSSATATKSADNTWIPVLCEYIADNSRAVFASDQTATNATSRAVSDAIQFISFGENLAGGSDAEINLAYVSIWDVQLSDPNEASFLGGSCPSGIDASNLIGYWDLQTNSGTQTNAGVDAGGDLTVTGATYSATGGPGVSCTTTPTFTAGPSAGTITSTTIPVTFTSDTTGTVKGTACTNGNAGNKTETLAGQCSGGGAAVATISEAVTATVGDGATFTGLSPSTTYDLGFVIDAATDSNLYSLADQTTLANLAFSAAPSCSPTTNGVSCTYTASAASTAYGVCVNPGDGTPSASQIKAGQNDGGTAALWAGSDSNSGTSDTITVTGANTPVRMNCHFVLNNAGGDSSVDSSQTNKDRSPRSGFAIVAAASAAGIFDLDADFNPDVAVGDVFEYETAANENAGCAVAITTAGDVTLTPTSPGDCDGRITFEASYQDVSNATTGLFSAPTAGNFSTDDTNYVNNTAPICAPDPEDQQIVDDEDEAATARDFTNACQDEDGDTLTFTFSAGTPPNGKSLSSAGIYDGTPDTEDEAGAELTVEACDPAGDCDTFDLVNYVINTWTVPNLVGRTASEAASDICDAAPWRCDDIGLGISGLTCDAGTAGLVLTQDPAASAEAEPFEDISTTLSRTCAAGGTGKTKQMRARKTPGAIRVIH